MNRKIPTLLAILIIFVVIAAIVGIIFWLFPDYPENEVVYPQAENVQEETADWQTYRNEEMGFEIKYPSNWGYSAGPLPEVFLFGITGSSDYDVNIWVKSSSQLNEFYGSKKAEMCTENFLVDKKAYKCEGDNYIYIEAENSGKFYFLSVKGDRSSDKFTIFNQMLSTFRFIEPEIISEGEAIDLVKNLPEVKEWLALFTGASNTSPTTDGSPMVVVDSKLDQGYSIHVYEQLSDHTATFNWYRVDSETGEITSMFLNRF